MQEYLREFIQIAYLQNSFKAAKKPPYIETEEEPDMILERKRILDTVINFKEKKVIVPAENEF